MGVTTMRRLAALLMVVSGGAIAGCFPRVVPNVESMTLAEIESAVAAIPWRGCATVARAALPGGTTNVEICAAPNAHTYGPRNAPGGGGAPVARIRNTGDSVEARWGLKPRTTYSIWLHRDTAGATVYTVIGSGVNRTGTYVGCRHTPADSSRANFGTCSDNPWPLAGGARSRGPSSSGENHKGEHTLLDRATGPAWITCTDGCCTTGSAIAD